MKSQSGFTLIELITVIVILGILSAFAIPRFAGLEAQARSAAIQGLAGSLRSGAALAHAVWLANGSSGATVTLEGTVVSMDAASGYPLETTAGISSTIQDLSGFVDDGAGSYNNGAPNPGTCQVQYTLGANPAPSVVVTTNDCS